MIFVVDAANRSQFATDLAVMHRQRKAVFVDRAGWKLPVVADQEIDRYDLHSDTMYLLSKRDCEGTVMASVRLLTTTGPHLMCELFRAGDRAKMPRGPTVWEASRFYTAPDIHDRGQRHALLWEIICGVMETGLLYGIHNVIFAAGRPLVSLALNCGWDVTMLGRDLSDQGDEVTAVAAAVTPAGLRRVRRLHGVLSPVARFTACGPRFPVEPVGMSLCDDAKALPSSPSRRLW